MYASHRTYWSVRIHLTPRYTPTSSNFIVISSLPSHPLFAALSRQPVREESSAKFYDTVGLSLTHIHSIFLLQWRWRSLCFFLLAGGLVSMSMGKRTESDLEQKVSDAVGWGPAFVCLFVYLFICLFVYLLVSLIIPKLVKFFQRVAFARLPRLNYSVWRRTTALSQENVLVFRVQQEGVHDHDANSVMDWILDCGA